MNEESRVYESGDYAGILAGDLDLYYGYEYGSILELDSSDPDIGEKWGFVAKRRSDGRVAYSVAFPWAGCDQRDEMEPTTCLLNGIRLMLEEGVLGLKNV